MYRQHGSHARSLTGAQNVEKAAPWFMKARASPPIAAPVLRHMVRLNDMPVVIGNGKLVCRRMWRGGVRSEE